jgi:hypothetical protein
MRVTLEKAFRSESFFRTQRLAFALPVHWECGAILSGEFSGDEVHIFALQTCWH